MPSVKSMRWPLMSCDISTCMITVTISPHPLVEPPESPRMALCLTICYIRLHSKRGCAESSIAPIDNSSN